MTKKNTIFPIELPPCIGEIRENGGLPDPDLVSYYMLEKDRRIYLDTDVDENLMAIHRLIVRWNIEDKGKPIEERKPIWLCIMSNGGSIDYMTMLLDAIESSTTPVYTVNVGSAHSAAALIFMAGKKRFMSKNAKVLVHEGSASMGGDAIKVQDQADSYKKTLKWMKDYILEHTRIPKAQLMKRRANDWELDAQFCLENGVCDVVIQSMEEIL